MNQSSTNPACDGPKEVAIEGGGLVGCLTALLLAKAKTPAGEPLFHITIYEKDELPPPESVLQPLVELEHEKKFKLPWNGASLPASRRHNGGEYLKDRASKLGCLKGAQICALALPENIYTDSPPMRILAGENAHKNNYLTQEELLSSYEDIRLAYETDIYRLMGVHSLTKQQAEGALLGSSRAARSSDFEGRNDYGSDNAAFYRRLTHKELEPYVMAKGGIQTLEKGFLPPLFLSAVEDAISDFEKKGIIEVSTGTKVLMDGHDVDHLKRGVDGKFHLVLDSGEMKSADFVVLASWSGSFQLTPPRDNVQVWVHKRAIATLDTSQVELNDASRHPAFLIDDIGHGGMFAPYTETTALGYHTDKSTAYIRSEMLDRKTPYLPDDWELSDTGLEARKAAFEANLGRVFPFASKLKVHKLIVRDTISYQSELYQRRHRDTWEIEPGYFIACPTKATLAAQSAIETAWMLKQRALHPDVDIIQVPDAHELAIASYVPSERSGDLAYGPYSLRDVMEPKLERAMWFQLRHNEFPPGTALPAELRDLIKETEKPPQGPLDSTKEASSSHSARVGRRPLTVRQPKDHETGRSF